VLSPQVVGVRAKRSLMLTGGKLDATEAYRLGILSMVVAAGELDAETAKIAGRLAHAPQMAIAATKRLINAAGVTPLADQLRAESVATVACTNDPDFMEGVRAFVEKRAANFPSARF